MTHKTLRTILAITLAATLLFSIAYAYSSADDEQNFLSFFFDERQVDALQDYQERYTANEFLALKIRGKLPRLPTAQPQPEVEPAAIEEEQPVVADETTPVMEQSFLEEDKLTTETVVFVTPLE